jgi:hypothetical protein
LGNAYTPWTQTSTGEFVNDILLTHNLHFIEWQIQISSFGDGHAQSVATEKSFEYPYLDGRNSEVHRRCQRIVVECPASSALSPVEVAIKPESIRTSFFEKEASNLML